MSTKQPRPPKLSDVARIAGVSPGTVSIYVNGRVGEHTRISLETQERIAEAIRELGYVPNPVARSLARGRNDLVGVFTYEPIFPTEHGNFFYPFLAGIEEEAGAQDFNVLLFTSATQLDGKRRVYRNSVNSLQLAGGAILMGLEPDRSELSRLYREGYPFVFIGRREIPDGPIAYVSADVTTATEHMVRHLIQLGHRRLAYFRFAADTEPARDRETGYRQGHRQLEADFGPPRIHHTTALEEITPERFAALLADGVTAFVAETDSHARHLLASASTLGKRAPEHFSLVVLGDPLEPAPEIDWTMFTMPRRAIGREAVRLLHAMLVHSVPDNERQITVSCGFNAGQTAGPRSPVRSEEV
jgi:DNA-binding LacI/PurR family transcriptional regulator